MNHIKRSLFALSLVFLASCEGFFGTKTDSSFIDVPQYENELVAFVPIQPVISGFMNPTQVIVGYDELIYVTDQGAGEIKCYDLAANLLASFPLKGVKSITQDRTLDLLVIADHDTNIVGTDYTLDAVYRIEMKNGEYGLKNAYIEKKIIHPFYFKTGFSAADAQVRLNQISAIGNNNYYVSRSGPSDSPLQVGGPDDAILKFDRNDKYEGNVPVSTSTGGSQTDYFQEPFGIVTKAQPPQTYSVSGSEDFFFTSADPNYFIKVQEIKHYESENGENYEVNTDFIVGDTTKADGFLTTPGRFSAPQYVHYTGDGTNYIFVSDAEKDSVYLFTNTGLEGVPPLPGSTVSKNIKVSFGGTGSGIKQFNNPKGLFYYNKILYVCDAGNHRVLRFKLTTDFD